MPFLGLLFFGVLPRAHICNVAQTNPYVQGRWIYKRIWAYLCAVTVHSQTTQRQKPENISSSHPSTPCGGDADARMIISSYVCIPIYNM